MLTARLAAAWAPCVVAGLAAGTFPAAAAPPAGRPVAVALTGTAGDETNVAHVGSGIRLADPRRSPAAPTDTAYGASLPPPVALPQPAVSMRAAVTARVPAGGRVLVEARGR